MITNQEHIIKERENPFGQRSLCDMEKVFDYNAWDNVDWPEGTEEEIFKTLQLQKETSVTSAVATDLLKTPEKCWEAFYQKHSNRFFMDRKWLIREFSELFDQGNTTHKCVLDVGCGVGNTTIPLLEANPQLFIYCCDFSFSSINILRNDKRIINNERCYPFVWDITNSEGTKHLKLDSLDYIICVFVLSAIPPNHLKIVLKNLIKYLKPNGMLMIKDYGRFDLTQLRFKSNRLICENFYRRGDDTLVYFFDNDELDLLLCELGLKKIQNVMDKRLIINRAKKVKMYRRWIQCKYIKTVSRGQSETNE